jgi:hypothetical protein
LASTSSQTTLEYSIEQLQERGGAVVLMAQQHLTPLNQEQGQEWLQPLLPKEQEQVDT